MNDEKKAKYSPGLFFECILYNLKEMKDCFESGYSPERIRECYENTFDVAKEIEENEGVSDYVDELNKVYFLMVLNHLLKDRYGIIKGFNVDSYLFGDAISEIDDDSCSYSSDETENRNVFEDFEKEVYTLLLSSDLDKYGLPLELFLDVFTGFHVDSNNSLEEGFEKDCGDSCIEYVDPFDGIHLN